MDRKEFLKSLGLSSAALMAVYCLGTVTSCSPAEENPTPGTPPPNTGTPTGGGTTTGGKIDFSLDLSAAANAPLQTKGGFLYVDSIIVARSNSGDFVALSKSCTHAGTTIKFVPGSNNFNCENHGSNFNLDGSVINGPAGTSLKKYSTTFTVATNTLRVFE
ncbi:MAG: Rieske (2Fe-2S) protein [Verrucomicrobia bacterium]|nr:Rieske (2Fe-2S) protein [Cytophagales bacterium]